MSEGPGQRLTDPGAVRDAFARAFGDSPAQRARLYAAPGRINLIGEHTDYNDGFVLPATLDLYTWIAARPREDRLLRVTLGADREPLTIDLERLEPRGDGETSEYIKGVAWALREEGIALAGCDLAIGGNLPLGGGLSSSASLEVALALAMLGCVGRELGRQHLARVCQRAEADFVGMPCGLMDQYAVAVGQRGQALFLDCRSLECEAVPLPDGARLLVVHSGVAHRLQAGGEYRRRREQCAAAVAKLRAVLPQLTSLRDLRAEDLERHARRLDPEQMRRCRHVLAENARVVRARQALREGDLETLGALLDASHASLRDDYEVSCPELDRLVEIAGRQPGVLGSRMMGGGFGGCTISLVEAGRAEAVAAEVSRACDAELGRRPWMHVAGPAQRAAEWAQ